MADAASEMVLSDGPKRDTSVRLTPEVNVSGHLLNLAARFMGTVFSGPAHSVKAFVEG